MAVEFSSTGSWSESCQDRQAVDDMYMYTHTVIQTYIPTSWKEPQRRENGAETILASP